MPSGAVPDEPQAAAVVEAGIEVTAPAAARDPADLARALVPPPRAAIVVWVGSSDGDPGLSDAIAVEVTRLPEPPDVELLIGSFDVPGARLLDVVAVMDRLRSPGGCPWDAKQTHESLVPYLLEEAHEAIEAIESGDPATCRRSSATCCCRSPSSPASREEHPTEPFDIDDVAGGLVDKLVRRHPHVFADVEADTPDAVEANWETIKADEKQHRTHPVEGVPVARCRPWPAPRSTSPASTGQAATTSSTRRSRPATSAPSCWTSSARTSRGRRRRGGPARDPARARGRERGVRNRRGRRNRRAGPPGRLSRAGRA